MGMPVVYPMTHIQLKVSSAERLVYYSETCNERPPEMPPKPSFKWGGFICMQLPLQVSLSFGVSCCYCAYSIFGKWSLFRNILNLWCDCLLQRYSPFAAPWSSLITLHRIRNFLQQICVSYGSNYIKYGSELRTPLPPSQYRMLLWMSIHKNRDLPYSLQLVLLPV